MGLARASVGIVIPTKDRFEFLRMQLTYYAEVGCPHTIYIGDSSGESHLNWTRDLVSDLADRINIVHIPLPNANDFQAIYGLLQRVEEPYSAFAGDDDFLVPAALAKCADFLASNPDFSTAHGIGAAVGVAPNEFGGGIEDCVPYKLSSEEHSSAGERLTGFMSNLFESVFSVHRTDEFLSDVEATLPILSRGMRDLLVCCLAIVHGKSKKLDCFYLVRLSHADQNAGALDRIGWITAPDWWSSYQVFRDKLCEELIRQDGIMLDDAQAIVKQGFFEYLSRGFARDLRAQHRRNGTGYRNRVRTVASRIPAVRTAWKFARSRFPGSDKRLPLPALLRRSSRYHDDFLPIYRAICSLRSS